MKTCTAAYNVPRTIEAKADSEDEAEQPRTVSAIALRRQLCGRARTIRTIGAWATSLMPPSMDYVGTPYDRFFALCCWTKGS